MKTQYEPIGNTVLVEAIPVSTTIQLPDRIQSERYTVVKKGNGKEVPDIEVGDTVILTPGAARVHIKGTQYSIIRAEEVLARVRE